jgi:hypothetical protein
MKKNLGNLTLAVVTVVLCLIGLELALRGYESFKGRRYFKNLKLVTWESVYYHNYARRPDDKTPKGFHPRLGWINYTIQTKNGNRVINNITGDKWRPDQYVPLVKNKKRVVLIGDSFMYGWHLKRDETIDHFLSVYLGQEFEIINLSVKGYGIDQMALVAAEIATQFDPDVVVVGFIADDLRRSCTRFSYITNATKPMIQLKEAQIVFPESVPTPFENYLRHSSSRARAKDAIVSFFYSIRVVDLLLEPLVSLGVNECIATSNARLFDFIRNRLDGVLTLFVHLDGALPDQFVREMERLGVEYHDAARDINKIADRLGVRPDRHSDSDLHPKKGLNQVYAFSIYQRIRDSFLMRTVH